MLNMCGYHSSSPLLIEMESSQVIVDLYRFYSFCTTTKTFFVSVYLFYSTFFCVYFYLFISHLSLRAGDRRYVKKMDKQTEGAPRKR